MGKWNKKCEGRRHAEPFRVDATLHSVSSASMLNGFIGCVIIIEVDGNANKSRCQTSL